MSAALANLSCQFLRSLSIFSRVCSASCSGVSEDDALGADDSASGADLEGLAVNVDAIDDEIEERLDDIDDEWEGLERAFFSTCS